MSTFLIIVLIVRFAACPRRELALQWTVINPVELSVSFSVKPKPDTLICNCLLFLDQVKYEVIVSV